MALTSVRAQFNGAWYTLALNSATGKYETTLTPAAVSDGQPGGYYNVTVEAAGSTGASASASGSTMSGLRLVVTDVTPPVLDLVSPPEGHLTSNRPTVIMTATDEAGGSGIAPASLSVTLDGTAQTSASISAAGGGYRITYTPAADLPDGPHQITVSIRDKNGNAASRTLSYSVDTTAPALTLVSPVEGYLTEARPVIRLLAADEAGGSGVRSDTLQITLDGAAQASGIVMETAADGLHIAYTPPALPDGSHTVTASIRDYNGNEAQIRPEYYVDTAPPALALLAPPAGFLTVNRTSFVFTVEDGGSGVDFATLSVTVDGTALAASVTGNTVTATPAHALPDGPHILEASAADRAGNVGSLKASYTVDTEPPTLQIVSPEPGYVLENPVEFVLEAKDSGTGVAPDTLSVTLDGAALAVSPEGETARFTVRLEEGRHTLAASVSDRVGLRTELAAEYIVDTVPPVLRLTLPDSRRIVDTAGIAVAGTAQDETSGVERVAAAVNGTPVNVSGPAPPETFAFAVPLETGVNSIIVTARDEAGLETAEELTVIRLVTDRTRADLERVRDMCFRGYNNWTAAEKAWWETTRCRRGSYDAPDYNRVTAAMDWLEDWLTRYGYLTGYEAEPHGPWTDADAMTIPQGQRYRDNVERFRSVFPFLDAPETPASVRKPDLDGANAIEAILAAVDAVRPDIDRSIFYAGEIFAGEV